MARVSVSSGRPRDDLDRRRKLSPENRRKSVGSPSLFVAGG
jgi:hypothetical protein